MANLSTSDFDDEPELIRERDPDADNDEYDDLEGVKVYFYEGPNHVVSPSAKKRIAEDIREMKRKPSPFDNPVGSGFSPEEVAEARKELNRRILE